MKPSTKAYLIFSIVFWLLVLAGLLLFGLSFGRVSLNNYALRRNYFSSKVDAQQYFSGAYHKQLGYYFLEFPSSKRYLREQRINVTNDDMKKVGIEYTLIYRIRHDKVYSLYSEMALIYEQRILAYINSIISNHFANIGQSESRVSQQSAIVETINYIFNAANSGNILFEAIQIEGLWLDELDFYEEEIGYESAFLDSSSYSEAFDEIEIQMMKTAMEVETLKNVISSQQRWLELQVENSRLQAQMNATANSDNLPLDAQIFLSQISNITQILQYYPGVTINFT